MEITKLKRRVNRLRKHRKERGLNQREVARILGMKSASMISRWEKGTCLPDPVTMFKLAILYRTMVDALFFEIRRSLLDEMREREDKVLRRKDNRVR